MSYSQYFPIFMSMMAPQENRDEMLQLTLPSMMPVSKHLQGAASAMMANSVTTNHAIETRNTVDRVTSEVITAVRILDQNPDIDDKKLGEQFPLIKKHKLISKIRARAKAEIVIAEG